MKSKLSPAVLIAAPLALTLAMLAAGAAQAQPSFHPVQDYKAAPAGDYAIDRSHTALIARVPHVGFSYSMFRFRAVSGSLKWDPANPAADALSITVDPASIATADTGGDFPGELGGAQFLDVGKFPAATFVSTAFHVVDATHGKVEGDLTIKGVKTPAVFDVTLVGAGQGFHGPVIGVTARTTLDAKAYGLPALLSAPIELIIDTEFDAKADR